MTDQGRHQLCLRRLRSAQARRERTTDAWLPEPLLDAGAMLGPADSKGTSSPRTPG